MKKSLTLLLFVIIISCNKDKDVVNSNIILNIEECQAPIPNDIFMNFEIGKSMKFKRGIYQNNEVKYSSVTTNYVITGSQLIDIEGKMIESYIGELETDINGNISISNFGISRCNEFIFFYCDSNYNFENYSWRFLLFPKSNQNINYTFNETIIKSYGYKEIELNGIKYNTFEVISSNVYNGTKYITIVNYYVENIGLVISKDYDIASVDDILSGKDLPYAFIELILEN